jgi:hypothetical protein
MARPLHEQRSHSVKRAFAFAFMRNGEVQESKAWAQVGKGLCVWLLVHYPTQLFEHETVFGIIMVSLIAPDLLKKLITMWSPNNRVGTLDTFTHSEHAITPLPKIE